MPSLIIFQAGGSVVGSSPSPVVVAVGVTRNGVCAGYPKLTAVGFLSPFFGVNISCEVLKSPDFVRRKVLT